jgi:hypothetical protein
MPLLHRFADPGLNLALESFLRLVRGVLGNRLLSVVLYGSVAFDDLAPGYGDLDFLAVVDHDLSKETRAALVDARAPLRRGDHGVFGRMLEGPFLPRKMLNPAVTGEALWWGTSGERPWRTNKLGALVHCVIRERGIVIWGRDVRHEVPAPTPQELMEDVRAACENAKQHGRGGALHSVDWLLTIARLLLWLREGRLSSKSEAADWAYGHAHGAWREFLPQAKRLRLNPSLAAAPEVQRWLDSLTDPIRQACAELEHEIAQPRG